MMREFDIAMLDSSIYDRAVEALLDDPTEATAFASSEFLDTDVIAAMICGQRTTEDVKAELRGLFKTWLQQYRVMRIAKKARAIAETQH